MVKLRIPLATYRLQLNQGFKFKDSQSIVPYLARLGISDIYTSPILKARKGSMHGYDVTDPACLNPELGTDIDFQEFSDEIAVNDMGYILDIVPNHMAASLENPWWVDVLENGRASPFATYFDIDWYPPINALKNKVLLPILTHPLSQVLKEKELILSWEETGLCIQYHNLRLPLNIGSYNPIFSHNIHKLEAMLGADSDMLQKLKRLLKAAKQLPQNGDTSSRKTIQHHQTRKRIKNELLDIVNSSPEVRAFLCDNIALFNSKKDKLRSFRFLNMVLNQQSYRLAYWKTGRNTINYRRFFDINDLIGIRVEDIDVFDATHFLVLRLVCENKVTGLRIDHTDGLFNPVEYLYRIQHYITQDAATVTKHSGFYVVVEKILSNNETPPENWPIHGTSGYDFLNTVNSLFVDRQGLQTLDSFYSRFTGTNIGFDNVVYEKKRTAINDLFASDINMLAHRLLNLSCQIKPHRELSYKALKEALIQLTACLPIYRTYTSDFSISEQDRKYLENAVCNAKQCQPSIESNAFDFLKRVLLLQLPANASGEQKESWLYFVMRWQQFSGAVMAKGLEDTSLYVYNRLISLNDVGGNPGAFGLSIEEFHQQNATRQANWPYTMNATSTHDTKRGEDVRARINVISEIPEVWKKRVIQWHKWNKSKKQKVNNRLIPDSNMEIFLYQTLIGAWPFSEQEAPHFRERLNAYMIKAVREAKVVSNWFSPNLKCEQALLRFVELILEDYGQNKFLKDFIQFQSQIAYYGMFNSLTQTVLKATSPGIPDFYQGTELWDLNLVDPDNRRHVDFNKRISLLGNLKKQEARGRMNLIKKIMKNWEDGQLKLYIVYKLLNTRKKYGDLFLNGAYIPIKTHGQRAEHIFAFARRLNTTWALITVPRFATKLVPSGILPLGHSVWGTDVLTLPDNAPETWSNVFTGETVNQSSSIKGIHVSEVFRSLPVALLLGTFSDKSDCSYVRDSDRSNK